MAQHVPKFGNWDTDNVPYTAYFEHARREKAGMMMMMNPNDPMENPEALNTCMGSHVDADEVMASHGYSHHESSLEKGSHGVLGHHSQRQRHVHHRSRGSHGGLTTEFASEQSHVDHSVIHRGPQFDHNRNMSKGGSSTKSFSSSSHNTNRHKSRSSSFNDHANHQETAIPKFGAWDVTNPKSGEGYTAIFSKIREERQITSNHVSSISSTPPLNNCSSINKQHGGPSFLLSKCCCCLFPSENK